MSKRFTHEEALASICAALDDALDRTVFDADARQSFMLDVAHEMRWRTFAARLPHRARYELGGAGIAFDVVAYVREHRELRDESLRDIASLSYGASARIMALDAGAHVLLTIRRVA